VFPAVPQDSVEFLASACFLNVAATCRATRALGPGLRAALWVQGCAFRCPGCVAPDWIPIRPAERFSIPRLACELLSDERVTGLTISRGEPMLQASNLALLLRVIKSRRDLDVICFTGFTIEQLHQSPPGPGVTDLLGEIDVLIDGPYIQRLNDNAGLRGSRNQRILHLTRRLAHVDLETAPRKAEVHINQGHAMLVGVPPEGMHAAFQQSMAEVEAMHWELQQYERV
jgi:anaerobic ribonucleoside-triphosphate reductase activating protein